jgi:sarcosine oxidase delta subunit
MLDSHTALCPYCGEENELEIDASGGTNQAYVEDCQVCCRPWEVRVRVDADGDATLDLRTQDE